MISFSRFGNNGRLGNQLFQYAFLLALAKRHGIELRLPAWKYAQFFDADFPKDSTAGAKFRQVKEPTSCFHYAPEAYEALDYSKDIDFEGYFQSEKYFEDAKDLVRTQLKFKKNLTEQVRQPFVNVFKKPVIAIHARQGDYVGNPNYELLPATYFFRALQDNFPFWEQFNLLFFSDNIQWCRLHFECLPNAHFSEGNSDIEDLCLMSQCQHFILSNSTFSWWAAWLGATSKSIVVRPRKVFAGDLANLDTKDFYPADWRVFDNTEFPRLDLTDTTFVVPVFCDHSDRVQNLNLSVCLLQRYLDTNIIIGEQGMVKKFEYMGRFCRYHHFKGMKFFHRTKMLNDMIRMASTPVVVNFDADIVIPPVQLYQAVQQVKNGASMVYPYDGRFARVPRLAWFKNIEKRLDIGTVAGKVFDGMREGDPESFGGCVLFHKEDFIDGGMENENYVSFGNEDYERRWRFDALGFKIQRTKGALFHIDHKITINSTNKHPHGKHNKAVWEKLSQLTPDELKEHVSRWHWAKQHHEVSEQIA